MSVVVRVLIILPLIALVMWFTGVFYMLADPIYNNVINGAELQRQLGVDPSGTIMFFAGLAFILFILGLVAWAILGTLTTDVRRSEVPRQ